MSAADKKAHEARVWQESLVYLTPEGVERLKRKLARLLAALPGLAAEAARTGAYGDRSDNAEYKEAKMQLRRTQRQVWTIEDQLKRVILIPAGAAASGIVALGSTVVVSAEDGAQKTFEILGPHETDPAKGRISHQSPLGAALLGRTKGAVVTIRTVGGVKTYTILEVR